MNHLRWVSRTLAAVALLCTARAQAHFTLLEPASWLNEDPLGGPQKGSPCGPGDTRPFIGDDVQPIPVSNAVTTFRAGETITVAWEETVYHPGYYRIALARTAPADATSADLPDPPLTDPVDCYYDRAAVQTVPHDDVLADGLFMAEEISSDNRSLSHEVTLPDEPCERCTLQVVQVMEGHGGSSCFYFHCAEIAILPADSGGAGTSGAAGSGAAGASAAGVGGTGAAGMGAAGGGTSGMAETASDDGGGCAVARGGAGHGATIAWALVATALFLGRRSRRSRSSAVELGHAGTRAVSRPCGATRSAGRTRAP